MQSFKSIRARAELRKGGADALSALLPAVRGNPSLAKVADDRILSEMTERIFCSGFVWSIVKAKWPGFEAAFEGFEIAPLLFAPDEFWEVRTSDTRIIRHGAKIMAVRSNAAFIADIAREHKSFGRFLAAWPADDGAGLLALLAKRGNRLGGMTGQYFLRYIGWDMFVLSRDVIACLRDAGVEISEKATSKRDLATAQAAFNAWHAETGLSYTHLSRIAAMSVGSNDSGEAIHGHMNDPEA